MMTKLIRASLATAAVAAFAAATASESEAQVCIGFPTGPAQMATAFTANFPTGGNTIGGEFNYNFPGPANVFVGVSSFNPEIGDAITSVGGGVAFDFAPLTAALPGGISACPVAGVTVAFDGDDSLTSIPLGVGFGSTFALGDTGLGLSPYVVPQVQIRTGDTGSNDFFLSGGALLNITEAIYAGATVNRFFVENAESEFGLKIGVVF